MLLRAVLAVLVLRGFAVAQQPISYAPAGLQSGSPILFRVAEGRASAVSGTWLGHALAFTRSTDGATWYAVAGVDVEQAPGTYALAVAATMADGSVRRLGREVLVGPAHYRTTTIQVPQKFLAPDAATKERVAEEQAVKAAAFGRVIPEALWSGSFAAPVPSTPTDSFGTRRTFNGTLASIHKGADFHASMGTPVYAANDGIVTIAQPMFYEGNFVVVDHGQQLESLYMHFSRIDVRVGERVHKGQRLGLSGATGRVNGPHLHFAIRWQGTSLDPALLLKMALPERGGR